MTKRKKRIIWILIILAIAFGGYFFVASGKPQTVYTTETAERGTLAQTVSVTGEVKAPEQTDLAFKISGRIEQMFVDIGDTVQRGQKIATIDKGALNTELRQAREEVTYQKKTLSDMKRRKSTYTKEQEDAQRAHIRKAEEAVNEILVSFKETTLYSPVSGVVISRNINVGEITVANAVNANSSVVTIAQEGPLYIESNVPESDIVKISLGQRADVTFDALPSSEVLDGRVSKIEPASTVIQDVVYYKVRLAFDMPDPRLKIGMSADADIHTAEKDMVLFVPERVIKVDGNKKTVDILLPDNTTKTVEVVTGLRGDEGMIEIVSGLRDGDKVVSFTKAQ